MFDIGFWELMLVAVVALIVVGPERFPGMIKKVAYWIGKFRRIAATVKSEISEEVDKAEQLQNLLQEQKEILRRNASIDLSQPAVKPKSLEQKAKATDEAESPSDSSSQAVTKNKPS
ncbi:MAG TPA: twin-arginine translocase subunit TatB [Gammaproteobacteria bacterium]|nr:twin-arginine translocase subunit TatB [Gammaproteobacteria bacterium]